MNYHEMRDKIVEFTKTSGIDAYTLIRIGKDLCCCRTCRFYVQHYSKEGTPVDFGHCIKNNIIKGTRPHKQSCGWWALDKENEDANT